MSELAEETSTEQESTDEVVEHTEAELEAIEHGWNPDGAEGKRNLSAEEFMDRQPLYDDIRSLKKQTRKLQDGIEAMKQMQDGIRHRERQQVIAELNIKKKEALQEEDYDEVIKIDDKILETRTETEEPKNNIAFETWVEDNQWYAESDDMRGYADMIGAGYYQQNPNKSKSDVYEYVTKEVKKRFPDNFNTGNKNRRNASPVESAEKGRAGRERVTKYKVSDLPEDDRRIMRTILRADPKMSEQDYLKSYFG